MPLSSKRTKAGSITVFLALVLVLLFSSVLTTLEAARMAGARAYLKMVSDMAGDSLLATYYVPLFQQYRLFGIEAGYGSEFLSKETLEHNLAEDISYSLSGMRGGLLSMESPTVAVKEYRTLLSDSGSEFLRQVKEQSVYEGFSIALDVLFPADKTGNCAAVGELYQEQSKLQEETANTAKELLQLMSLTDGIKTGKQGIQSDKSGNLKTETVFIKQLAPMSKGEMKQRFENDFVFDAICEKLIEPQTVAARIGSILEDACRLQEEVEWLEDEIAECQEARSDIVSTVNFMQVQKAALEAQAAAAKLRKETELAAALTAEAAALKREINDMSKEATAFLREQRTAETERNTKRKMMNTRMEEAKSGYELLRNTMKSVLPKLQDAKKAIDRLEIKQKAARLSAKEYEQFLQKRKGTVSEELYQIFAEELADIKGYLGMEEQGYVPEIMRQSVRTDQSLLEEIMLPAYKKSAPSEMRAAVLAVEQRIGEYTLEGLWFSYGNIHTGKSTGENAADALGSLLSDGVLSLVGISKNEVSSAKLSGGDLPSQGEDITVRSELMDCISELSSCFSEEGLLGILRQGVGKLTDILALELYFYRYFGNYIEPEKHTKLLYEREYLLFGQEKDKENLTTTVLYLIALRFVFTLTALMTDKTRMSQIETLAAAIAGFTGIPILLSVIKYAVLLLWAVEEAVIEAAALLKNKRIALYSASGQLSIGELFTFSKATVKSKAEKMETVPYGASYSEYLLLLSLMQGVKKKCCRALDLIQENMRYRYRDSFRVRNVIVSAEFCTRAVLRKKYISEVFSDEMYQMEINCRAAYEASK